MSTTVPGEETPEELDAIREEGLKQIGPGYDMTHSIRSRGRCSCLDAPESHRAGCGRKAVYYEPLA